MLKLFMLNLIEVAVYVETMVIESLNAYNQKRYKFEGKCNHCGKYGHKNLNIRMKTPMYTTGPGTGGPKERVEKLQLN
eukprot:723722-Ditylum_brightwellii.AAC.1